jgi:hypothetical protein
MKKDDVASRPPSRSWVRPEDYVEALARRRTARRSRDRGVRPRTQPETPRLLLSTLPFVVLTVGLAVLTLAIAITAWPHTAAAPARAEGLQETGTASKGWFQDAQKDFKPAG